MSRFGVFSRKSRAGASLVAVVMVSSTFGFVSVGSAATRADPVQI